MFKKTQKDKKQLFLKGKETARMKKKLEQELTHWYWLNQKKSNFQRKCLCADMLRISQIKENEFITTRLAAGI
jgi:hypothetical protein